MNEILLTVILTVVAVHLVNFIIALWVDASPFELGWEPMIIMMTFTVSIPWYLLVRPWIVMYWSCHCKHPVSFAGEPDGQALSTGQWWGAFSALQARSSLVAG